MPIYSKDKVILKPDSLPLPSSSTNGLGTVSGSGATIGPNRNPTVGGGIGLGKNDTTSPHYTGQRGLNGKNK